MGKNELNADQEMAKNELKNLEISLDLLQDRNAYPPIVEEFESFGRRKASLFEVFNWMKKNKKSKVEAWIITQHDYCEPVVRAGADVNAYNDYALWETAKNRQIKIVKFLLDNGADDENICNYIIMLAAWDGCLEIVKFLTEAINDDYADYRSALKGAIRNGHSEIAEFLDEIMTKKNLF